VNQLDQLENQSVYILREAFHKFERLAMLWSIGKDSTVLLWLARKAFFGHVPFPLVHVDTSYKIPLMIEYRDQLVREWGLKLVVGRNEEVLARGETFPNGKATRVGCCGTLKKDVLRQVLDQHHFTGVVVGVRRKIRIEWERSIRKRALAVVVTLEADVKFAEEEGVVKAINVQL